MPQPTRSLAATLGALGAVWLMFSALSPANPDALIEGTRAEWVTTRHGDRLIRTHATVRMPDGTRQSVSVDGGTIGDLTLHVSHTPRLERGQRVRVANGRLYTDSSAATALGYTWPVAQVPYYINPVNGDVSVEAAETAIRSGADAWGLQTSAPISLYHMGRTADTNYILNGVNAVLFREGYGAGMAVTYSWASGSRYIEFDMVFYDGNRFFTGTSGCVAPGWYLEDIATHEFGHSLGLGHSEVLDATMYPGLRDCSQTFRTLALDDITGLEALYPVAPEPEPTPEPTPNPKPCRGNGKKAC